MGDYRLVTNAPEDQMIEWLMAAKGYRKNELFRAALRELYRKERPPYAVSKKTEEEDPMEAMSNEDYCQKYLGGEVVDFNGAPHCKLKRGSGTIHVPLKTVKNYN